MENRKMLRDALVVGFAMFAIYFGAGNLIFPPFIGFETGTHWVSGLIGLVMTGIALPILAVAAVANAGGTFKDLTRPITPWFHQVYNILVMIGVGMLITIPRTAAVAYETGFSVILPTVGQGLLKPLAIIGFFALTYYFANDRSKVIDKVGKVLTPVLLIILVGIVILAIVNPLGSPVATELANPFYFAFTQAYQTGDVLTGSFAR
jgi:LIVCS family branched-chain amino acid:cation transporter